MSKVVSVDVYDVTTYEDGDYYQGGTKLNIGQGQELGYAIEVNILSHKLGGEWQGNISWSRNNLNPLSIYLTELLDTFSTSIIAI